MSQFQSYLIIAQNQKSAREKTQKLAKSLGVNLDKISPDIFIVRAAKKELSIDLIREIKSHIYQKPVQYQYKLIIIENAHNATIEAQNALLKILEEPPNHAIIILEAKNKSLLLPTITSRVVVISGLNPFEPQSGTNPVTLTDENLESALEQIASTEDPEGFLDEQIVKLTELLIKSAKEQDPTLSKIESAIESCARAKELIGANVNPTFTLANLIFSIHLPQQ